MESPQDAYAGVLLLMSELADDGYIGIDDDRRLTDVLSPGLCHVMWVMLQWRSLTL